MTLRQQLSFPRQHARTQRFTLGAPRAFTVSPDGARVTFLRSSSGTDRVNSLWVLDLEDSTSGADGGSGEGRERIAADPAVLLGGAVERLSPEERARRERSREGSGGIVGYAVDGAGQLAAFALSGRLFTAELLAGTTRELPVRGPVIDPRPSPDGRHVAYVADGALRVITADGERDRELAGRSAAEGEDITYGLAEFIAAEEMSRNRGYWWSPESDRLLVARVDTAPVRRWWISDPAHPEREPVRVAYPAAGTPNADVRLFLVGLEGSGGDGSGGEGSGGAEGGQAADGPGGAGTEAVWDRARYPYLARVHWSAAGVPLLLVQSRDQRGQLYLAVDTATGATTTVHRDEDPAWLELFAELPAWAPDGRLVRIADEGGARVLMVGDRPLTGPQLHVRAVLDIGEHDVLVSASAGEEAADPEIGEIHVYRVSELGVERLSEGAGVHSAVRTGEVTVLVSAGLDTSGASARVLRDGKRLATVASYPEQPVLTARPVLTEAGAHRIPCAVLLPSGYEKSDGPLPVLLDPYGGPHGQRVVAAQNAYLTSQWFADQGFAVIVADGRGTPGRSPAWEKAVKQNLLLSLDDQIEALHALAERFPLDLGRVAMRGWSFGGYLAGLAVLRRPDVFHAAVSGAPVTDLRLYDTHYQERYLGGGPQDVPEVYAAHSLVTDDGLSAPESPARPLMIIHGLADDNVVVAHTLRLSAALLAAGRPHEVLPLTGVTHMTPQEEVAENLLLLQVDFLKRSLGLG
ncbi:prolyl oligopeptidase family serine peptidase [Streptomyces sp. 35G-GA-8]|uniref:prolyl oligopeptidase family serine peptidase n=1 Tax=Streptomyces sp. 35G-GA-8 TaxID=2939434 RepID=UPI00201FAF2E|nr:prolyl oligopeptidase family serine peptidase [Streptomyces sp. 35G-GA-8]MCL7375897.1 prolyl oligopeptidase family serine peptidase [Streptomyces sp. 35G-GA-8]